MTIGSVSATCRVTVFQPVTGIRLSQSSAVMEAGDTLSLTANVTPNDAADKRCIWSSFNPAVADVNENGVVTALTKVKRPSVSKVKSFKAKAGKKKLTLSWKKVSGAAGYQVQIGIKKNFKGAKTISVSKSKKNYVRKGLKSKKKYFIRIRAYKVYKNTYGTMEKVYGSWNKISKKTK